MNTYGQSTSLFISLCLSYSATLSPHPFSLSSSPLPFTFAGCLRSPSAAPPIALCSVRYIVAQPSPSLSRPSRQPLSRLREPSVKHPRPSSNPRAARRHRCSSDSKKGPREMAPLCVPNLCRTVLPCSFTRGDKSGASRPLSLSLSLPPSLTLYPFLPPYRGSPGTPRYADLSPLSLFAFLSLGTQSIWLLVIPTFAGGRGRIAIPLKAGRRCLAGVQPSRARIQPCSVASSPRS